MRVGSGKTFFIFLEDKGIINLLVRKKEGRGLSLNILKKLLPLQIKTKKELMHAGEVYYLWEGLTSGYKLIEVTETYLMNTEDVEIHAILLAIAKGTDLTRVKRLEKILKDEGFTVPPHPATKTIQGKPGASQEVKLSDDEILFNLIAWGRAILQNDAKAVGAVTNESIRKIFTDLIFDDVKAFNAIITLTSARNAFHTPPPASAMVNGLNMEEVGLLWEALNYRHLSIMNLEEYWASTNDSQLISLLERGLNQIALPQLEEIENVLKNEGFTIPARPVRREMQAPPGQANKIKLKDNEIIGVLTAAFQFAIIQQTRGFYSSKRRDIRELYTRFLSTEIEDYQKLIELATNRHSLNNPPVVSSLRI